MPERKIGEPIPLGIVTKKDVIDLGLVSFISKDPKMPDYRLVKYPTWLKSQPLR